MWLCGLFTFHSLVAAVSAVGPLSLRGASFLYRNLELFSVSLDDSEMII